jgi:hypothetical protein
MPEPRWTERKTRLQGDYGWKFGNTIDGCQAEFVRVRDAMVNLGRVDEF